jgi:hypothetical protein
MREKLDAVGEREQMLDTARYLVEKICINRIYTVNLIV